MKRLFVAVGAAALFSVSKCNKPQAAPACPPTRGNPALETIHDGSGNQARDAEPVVVSSQPAICFSCHLDDRGSPRSNRNKKIELLTESPSSVCDSCHGNAPRQPRARDEKSASCEARAGGCH